MHLHIRLNQPSSQVRKRVDTFYQEFRSSVSVSVAQEREALGKSWNFMIEESSAPYVTIWNVDDWRHPDSIESQLEIMVSRQGLGACYGPFGETKEFGQQPHLIHQLNPRSRSELRSGMHLGPFFMVRRSVLDQIGKFDEQLESAADYDLAIRIAYFAEIGHVDRSLGNFLNEGKGLSTRNFGTQAVERTVVELRYGLGRKARRRYLAPASFYNIGHRLENGKWLPANQTTIAVDDVSSLPPPINFGKLRAWWCRVRDWLDAQWKVG